MRAMDIVRRAAKNLRQAKGRTVLTSLAIGVGAFTIALAMAAGNGGRAYLDTIVSGAGDMQTVQVTAKQAENDANAGRPKKINEAIVAQGDSQVVTLSDLEKIKKIDGVERVLPIFNVNLYSVSVEGGDEYQGVAQVQYDNTAIDLSAGSLSEGNEILSGQTILPYKYVEPLGFSSAEEAIGKNVKMTFIDSRGDMFTRELRIVAVDKEPTSPIAYYEDQFRISNADGRQIAEAQRPAEQEESYLALMVTVDKGASVDEVKQRIVDTGDYEATTFAEARTEVMKMVNIVQYGLMGFGALAILASVFGIINTQYISVLERTQQIGLMKALGTRRRDIGKLFRYEAAWIGFLGGVIGVGLAYLVTLLNPLIDDALKLDKGTDLLRMDWLMSGVLIVGLMLVAILSGWFPSRKAAKLDPIEALRTE